MKFTEDFGDEQYKISFILRDKNGVCFADSITVCDAPSDFFYTSRYTGPHPLLVQAGQYIAKRREEAAEWDSSEETK